MKSNPFSHPINHTHKHPNDMNKCLKKEEKNGFWVKNRVLTLNWIHSSVKPSWGDKSGNLGRGREKEGDEEVRGREEEDEEERRRPISNGNRWANEASPREREGQRIGGGGRRGGQAMRSMLFSPLANLFWLTALFACKYLNYLPVFFFIINSGEARTTQWFRQLFGCFIRIFWL